MIKKMIVVISVGKQAKTSIQDQLSFQCNGYNFSNSFKR